MIRLAGDVSVILTSSTCLSYAVVGCVKSGKTDDRALVTHLAIVGFDIISNSLAFAKVPYTGISSANPIIMSIVQSEFYGVSLTPTIPKTCSLSTGCWPPSENGGDEYQRMQQHCLGNVPMHLRIGPRLVVSADGTVLSVCSLELHQLPVWHGTVSNSKSLLHQR